MPRPAAAELCVGRPVRLALSKPPFAVALFERAWWFRQRKWRAASQSAWSSSVNAPSGDSMSPRQAPRRVRPA